MFGKHGAEGSQIQDESPTLIVGTLKFIVHALESQWIARRIQKRKLQIKSSKYFVFLRTAEEKKWTYFLRLALLKFKALPPGLTNAPPSTQLPIFMLNNYANCTQSATKPDTAGGVPDSFQLIDYEYQDGFPTIHSFVISKHVPRDHSLLVMIRSW